MAIEVEGNPDLAMAQSLTGYLRVNATGEHMRRVGVAEIMKTNAGEIGVRNLAIPIMSKAIRL